MKKYLMLTFVSVFLGLFVANNASAVTVTGALVGNYSTSTSGSVSSAGVSTETKLDAGAMGFGAGFLFEFAMGPSAGFEIGTLYNMRKAEGSAQLAGLNVTVTDTESYLDLPVLIKLHFGAFQIGFGGYYSVPAGKHKTEVTLSNGIVSATASGSVKENFDYGAAGALGFTFSKQILLEGRYKHGMHDTTKGGSVDKWQEMQVLLGLVF